MHALSYFAPLENTEMDNKTDEAGTPGDVSPTNQPELGVPDDLITPKEAGKLAHNTHRATIMRWILKGKLPAYKFGKRFLVSKADVLGLITRFVPPAMNKDDLPPTRTELAKRAAYVDERLRAAGVRR